MKISFVTTVLNEESSILNLLNSLESQTRKPDEVIIVDGGSTDTTLNLIKSFQKKSKINIRVFTQKSNRSRGRNLGVRQSRGQGIAVSDAGCSLDKNWLKLIAQPLIDRKADVVGGFYRMKTNSFFTHCSAPFVGTMSHNIDTKNFLPSSRSIAFTKAAWKKIGGYPTHLEFAEDLIFAQKLKNHLEINMIIQPQATVEWTPPKSITQFFTSIKNYTSGNIAAGYTRHLKKNYLVLFRWVIGLNLVIAAIGLNLPLFWLLVNSLAIAYLLYPSLKFIKLVKRPIHLVYFALLQITSDLAVVTSLISFRSHSSK